MEEYPEDVQHPGQVLRGGNQIMIEEDTLKASLFRLFEGRITGDVKNPVTGNVHSRKDLMDHYRYLMKRSIDDPANIRLRKIMRLVADLLEIPMDIHAQLIAEAWQDITLLGDVELKTFIKADVEAMYNRMTGDSFTDRIAGKSKPLPTERKELDVEHGLLDHYSGVYDEETLETYNALLEMEEEDISMGCPSGVMKPSRDSPFTSDGWTE
jgi:hypothetical protein